jgi:MFS family permease
VLAGVREGVRYAWGFAPIRAMLLLLSAASLLGAPYQVLMPLFAADVLHGDAHTLGILTAASGVGAIIGALYLASRRSVVGLGRILVLSAGCFGLSLAGFSLVRHVWGAVLALIGVSGGMMVLTTSSNILLQTIVEEAKRGRVMSLYTMTYMGMAPLGSFLAGSVATQIGAPPTVRLGGLCCLIGALVFARHLPTLREIVRPLYVTRGLMRDAT